MKLLENEIYDIESLMDVFQEFDYWEIVKVAHSVEIKNIFNEESVLAKEQYELLKDKLLEKSQVEKEDISEYIVNDSFIEEEILSEIDDVNENKKIPSLKDLKSKNALNEKFMFESIDFLNIKDIDGNAIEDTQDINSIYINEEDHQKIIKKTQELNAKNANKHNPMLKEQAIATKKILSVPEGCKTMEQLSSECGIEIDLLVRTACELDIPYIYNKDSFTKESKCSEIIEKLRDLTFPIVKLEEETKTDSSKIEKKDEEYKVTMEKLSQTHDINVYKLLEVAKKLGFNYILYPDSYAYKKQAQAIIDCIKSDKEPENKSAPAGNMLMEELSDSSGIEVQTLIKAAQELGMSNVLYPNSYAYNENCKKILEQARIKKNGLKIVKKNTDITLFEQLIQDDTLVFIDTSSLMNLDMPAIIENEIIPILMKYDKTVFIVDSVIHEISMKIKQTKNLEYQEKAKVAQSILSSLIEEDLYQIPETHSVNKYFADAELITVFSDLRLKYNLCLITNDNSSMKNGGLSNSICELQTSTCINEESIKKITVLYVEEDGLVEYTNNRSKDFTLHKKAPVRVVL